MSVFFQDKTSPQIAQAVEDEATLLLPLGQTEEHGPHLQTGCDTIIADHVESAVAQRMQDEAPVLVLPSIAYGYVPKAIQQWPGSFRIRWDVMVNYVADVLVSAAQIGFNKMIVISTHGHMGTWPGSRHAMSLTGPPPASSSPCRMASSRSTSQISAKARSAAPATPVSTKRRC